MFKNLKNLLEEADALSEKARARHEPKEKVREQETKIGTLPVPIRALYALAGVYEEKASRLAEQVRTTKHSISLARLQNEKDHAEERADILMRIYWWALSEQFSLENKQHGLAIRRGWVLVTYQVPTR